MEASSVDPFFARRLRGFRTRCARRRWSLLTTKWLAGEGGDLRQVGDAEHLVALGKAGEGFADERPGAAADAFVDLVQDDESARARRHRRGRW